MMPIIVRSIPVNKDFRLPRKYHTGESRYPRPLLPWISCRSTEWLLGDGFHVVWNGHNIIFIIHGDTDKRHGRLLQVSREFAMMERNGEVASRMEWGVVENLFKLADLFWLVNDDLRLPQFKSGETMKEWGVKVAPCFTR
jgi:hypothetical protein